METVSEKLGIDVSQAKALYVAFDKSLPKEVAYATFISELAEKTDDEKKKFLWDLLALQRLLNSEKNKDQRAFLAAKGAVGMRYNESVESYNCKEHNNEELHRFLEQIDEKSVKYSIDVFSKLQCVLEVGPKNRRSSWTDGLRRFFRGKEVMDYIADAIEILDVGLTKENLKGVINILAEASKVFAGKYSAISDKNVKAACSECECLFALAEVCVRRAALELKPERDIAKNNSDQVTSTEKKSLVKGVDSRVSEAVEKFNSQQIEINEQRKQGVVAESENTVIPEKSTAPSEAPLPTFW